MSLLGGSFFASTSIQVVWTPSMFYSLSQAYLKMLIVAGPALFLINAPFGRFSLQDSKLKLPGRLTFSLMELPALIFCFLAFASSDDQLSGYLGLSTPSWSHLKQLPIANHILASLYIIHYTNRAIVQPLTGPKRSHSHISVFVAAFLCQTANGYTMGTWLAGRSTTIQIASSMLVSPTTTNVTITSDAWTNVHQTTQAGFRSEALQSSLIRPGLLTSGISTIFEPLFLIGVIGWMVFFLANIYHDEILFNLRRPSKKRRLPAESKPGQRETLSSTGKKDSESITVRYEIPEGGLYSLVSYPNYLTEWLEWIFFSLAALSQSPMSPLSSQSLPLTPLARISLLCTAPPFLFPLMEIAVMLPRAVNGHQWYRSKFGVQGDGKGGRYPRYRRAVIPYIL